MIIFSATEAEVNLKRLTEVERRINRFSTSNLKLRGLDLVTFFTNETYIQLITERECLVQSEKRKFSTNVDCHEQSIKSENQRIATSIAIERKKLKDCTTYEIYGELCISYYNIRMKIDRLEKHFIGQVSPSELDFKREKDTLLEKRISYIDFVLAENSTERYLYDSRALLKLMSERQCLEISRLKADGKGLWECQSAVYDFEILNIGREIFETKEYIKKCFNEYKSCNNLKELVKKREVLENRFLIKTMVFSDRYLKLDENSDTLKNLIAFFEFPILQQFLPYIEKECKLPSDGSLPTEMGINVPAPQAESPEIGNAVAFADIFKTARPFESRIISKDPKDKKFVLDENGWPCFKKEDEYAETYILQSALRNSVPDGIYSIHYKGDIDLSIGDNNFFICPDSRLKTKDGLNRMCIDIHIKNQLSVHGIKLRVKSKKKNACLKELRVIMPGGSPLYEKQIEENPKKIVFNEQYLNHLRPFKVLRMMNFMYASPRLPKACIKIQKRDMDLHKGVYNWNLMSPDATECIVDARYNRTAENRAKLEDATWGINYYTDKRQWRGVPIEVVVELARVTGANPWINIPHNADESYIRLVANAFKELKEERESLKIHVEYSNEVWNGRFWGAKYINATTVDPHPSYTKEFLDSKINFYLSEYREKVAAAKGDDDLVKDITTEYNLKLFDFRKMKEDKISAEVQRYVDKSLFVFDIFEEVLGRDVLSRTIATFQKDPGRTRRILKYLKKLNKLDRVDSIATATYFHGCWGGNSTREGEHCFKFLKNSKRRGFFSARDEDEVFSLLLDELNPEGVYGVIKQLKAQQKVLKSDEFRDAQIDLVAYEGGQHLTIDNMPADLKENLDPEKKFELVKLIHNVNNDIRMGDLYGRLYEGWRGIGGKTHVNFIGAQSQSIWGSFGICTDINNCYNSPKYQSAVDYTNHYCEKED